MSSSKLIEQIIDAIDQGEEISIHWEELTSPEEIKQIKALLSVHRICKRINQQQKVALIHTFIPEDQWMHLIIKEKIGAGGFGQVYRAYDSVLQTDVAVKFLNQNIASIDDTGFLHEARLMATVRNPHVLAIHGAAKDKGVAGYWSDYLDGELLFKALENKSIHEKDKLSIIKDITTAVKATHENDVVHGDIKSLNVMLQPNRGAILLDFGSGRNNLINDENSGLIQASPIAMAPEQFDGQGNSQAADVFALGLLIVEIFMGQHSITNKTLEQIKVSVKELPTTISRMHIPRGWHRLLAAMLSTQPDQRPTIKTVVSRIIAIEEKPLKMAKRIALTTTFALLLGVTGTSLYSYFNIKQANQETSAINEIMSNTFLTVSPYQKGESVLLLDVVLSAEEKIKNSDKLSASLKHQLLLQTLKLNQELSTDEDQDNFLDRVNYLLDQPQLSPDIKRDVHMIKGIYYGQRKQFDLSEPEFELAIALPVVDKNNYDQQMMALLYLAQHQLEQEKFDEYQKLNSRITNQLKNTSQSDELMGRFEYLQANYYSSTFQRLKAHDHFLLAANYHAKQYHVKHQSVIGSQVRAASEWVLVDDPVIVEQGLFDLHNLLPMMIEVMGFDHVNTLGAHMNLAQGYINAGRPKQAIEVLLSMESQLNGKLGGNNMLTLGTHQKFLAWAYQDNQQLELAEEIFLKTIEKLKQHQPQNNHAAIRAEIDLMHFYTETNQLNKAIDATLIGLTDSIETYGKEHRLTLEIEAISSWLAYLTKDLNAHKNSQLLYQKHLQILGEEDHQTKSVLEDLHKIEQGEL